MSDVDTVNPSRAGRLRAIPSWGWAMLVAVALIATGAVATAAGDSGGDQSVGTTSTPEAAATTRATATTQATATTPSTSAVVVSTIPAAAPPTSAELAPTAADTSVLAETAPVAPSAVPESAVPGAMVALDVLAMIPVANEHRGGYVRDAFAYGDSTDAAGCRTRALVLKRDSLTPVQVDPVGCAVVAGDWYSRYDGLTWSDPAEIEIDHVIALKEAWDSGAWTWSPDRLAAFGNDLDDIRTLVAVTGSVNQDKADKDPSNWIPPADDDVCRYLADWVAIKARWSLAMDQSEFGRIRNLLTDRCPGQTIAPWAEPPVGLSAGSAPADVSVAPVLPVAGLPAAPGGSGCDPSYPSVCIPPPSPDLDCGDIADRRFVVLPPDPHHFDSDNDGLGCES